MHITRPSRLWRNRLKPASGSSQLPRRPSVRARRHGHALRALDRHGFIEPRGRGWEPTPAGLELFEAIQSRPTFRPLRNAELDLLTAIVNAARKR